MWDDADDYVNNDVKRSGMFVTVLGHCVTYSTASELKVSLLPIVCVCVHNIYIYYI